MDNGLKKLLLYLKPHCFEKVRLVFGMKADTGIYIYHNSQVHVNSQKRCSVLQSRLSLSEMFFELLCQSRIDGLQLVIDIPSAVVVMEIQVGDGQVIQSVRVAGLEFHGFL